MKKQSIVERIRKKVCKVEWTIAIRKRDNKLLFQENVSVSEREFMPIKNTFRYWKADPFLISFHGKRYLFFEMYDRLKRKGVLGFQELFENGALSKEKVCFEHPKHLSYPNVFIYRDSLYCIPESNQSGDLLLLKFNVEEEKFNVVKKLVTNYAVADTNILSDGDIYYLMTTPIKCGDNSSLLVLHELHKDGSINKDSGKVLVKDKSVARNGGNIIYLDGGKKIRVSQDCSKGYGTAINFLKILSIEDGIYREELIKKIFPYDINIKTKGRIDGIHTYNFDDRYEVIDFKRDNRFNIVEIIGYVYNLFYK